jgi:hypothetical protein
VTPGDPISAPDREWTFAPVPGSQCANGTETGVAVNLSLGSEDLVLHLAEGGACWEAFACAAGTASHINDTMDAAPVLAEAKAPGLAFLFNRDDPEGPFRNANHVYVPYCTGDLYVGTRVHTYDWFGPRPVAHVGARNMDAILRRLVATFPHVRRVFLTGISAGGYGATLNAWRVQKALPYARVDVLNDSGLMVDVVPDGRYGTMIATWAPVFPPGCPDCSTSLMKALEYSAGSLLLAPRRYGMLAYREDGTIALFFGLQGPQVAAQLDVLRTRVPAHVKTFYVQGQSHVLLGSPNVATAGVTVRQWVQAFVNDTVPHESAGP